MESRALPAVPEWTDREATVGEHELLRDARSVAEVDHDPAAEREHGGRAGIAGRGAVVALERDRAAALQVERRGLGVIESALRRVSGGRREAQRIEEHVER